MASVAQNTSTGGFLPPAGVRLEQIEGLPHFKKGKKQLINISTRLAERATIPQVMAKLKLINTVATEEFRQSADILRFEQVRVELRDR